MTTLREVAEELYGLVPDDFTAARTRAEKAARSAGDREAAVQISHLGRRAAGDHGP